MKSAAPIVRKKKRQRSGNDEGGACKSNELKASAHPNSTSDVAASSTMMMQNVSNHHDQTFSNGRCVNVSDRYEKVGRIGEGTYGVVYKAKDRITNKMVALKRCIPHHESSDGFPITTLREIYSLRVCREHVNVVSLQTVAVSRSGVFLVLEFCEHELASLIDVYYQQHQTTPFAPAAIKTLARQLFSALDFCHSHYIIHRDIKLSNLLYQSSTGQMKVADFGLSRTCERSDENNNKHNNNATSPPRLMTPNVVSLWYRSPELLFGASYYTMAIDMWAAGCVLAEITMGVPLLNGRNETEQIKKMVDCLGLPTSSSPNENRSAAVDGRSSGTLTNNDWPGLDDMPRIRDGSIRLPRSSRRTFLSDLMGTRRTSAAPSNQNLRRLPYDPISVDGIRLLTSLLRYDPQRRWTASQALQATYFRTEPLPTPVTQMPCFPSYITSGN